MWEMIELREIRVFLALAEELHFGRSAQRLGLTQSRVSQSLRGLEHKLGRQLLHRTSRRVSLTAAGAQFAADISPAYDQLISVLEHAHVASAGIEGTLRIGLLTAASGGPHLIAMIGAFERRHPTCEVKTSELPLTDRLGPLRRGEITLMAARLPLEQPDLTVGPILSREPRVLAVAADHPLAGRGEVSVEDLADYELAKTSRMLPKETAEAFAPLRTPAGRAIRRRRVDLHELSELITLVARGKIVHPTVPSFADHFGHPNIRYLPITDLPASESALVWRRRDTDPRLRAFIRVAQEILRAVPSA